MPVFATRSNAWQMVGINSQHLFRVVLGPNFELYQKIGKHSHPDAYIMQGVPCLQAVEAIDSERDILQADLDSKAEVVANLTEELELAHQQADDANR